MQVQVAAPSSLQCPKCLRTGFQRAQALGSHVARCLGKACPARVPCPLCHHLYDPMGLGTHVRTCKAKNVAGYKAICTVNRTQVQAFFSSCELRRGVDKILFGNHFFGLRPAFSRKNGANFVIQCFCQKAILQNTVQFLAPREGILFRLLCDKLYRFTAWLPPYIRGPVPSEDVATSSSSLDLLPPSAVLPSTASYANVQPVSPAIFPVCSRSPFAHIPEFEWSSSQRFSLFPISLPLKIVWLWISFDSDPKAKDYGKQQAVRNILMDAWKSAVPAQYEEFLGRWRGRPDLGFQPDEKSFL